MYDELIAELRQYNNDGTEELRRQAADAIENLSRLHEAQRQNLIALMNEEPEPQWISCSERLPEAGERVLCYCRANIYEVLKMRTSGDWFYDVHHIYMHDFVTHWMPLPSPPKEVRNCDT